MNKLPAMIEPEEIPAIPAGGFHDAGFWAKVRRTTGILSRRGLEMVFTLYYAAQRPETPGWAKATVFGALTYFVLPIDSVPDLIPGLGYSDDLAVLSAALATIATYINDEVRGQATRMVERLVGVKAQERESADPQ